MKKILALILSTWGINAITAIFVMNNGFWIFKLKTVDVLDDKDPNFAIYRFMRDVNRNNDFEISYYSHPDLAMYSAYNGTSWFCQADTSTLDGTISAIVAIALGLDLVDDTPCPLVAGTTTFQWSNFSMEKANVDELFVDDPLFVELVMAVHDEDWGLSVHIAQDERKSEYLEYYETSFLLNKFENYDK